MTPTRHYINAAVFGVLCLAFAGFLAYTAYHYLSGTENVTVKSFAPGVPAFFLFFLARREYRSAGAARKTRERRARLRNRGADGTPGDPTGTQRTGTTR